MSDEQMITDPRYEAGPSLFDRLDRLSGRLSTLEGAQQTGILGTDQTIKGSHDRLDALLGVGIGAPDGTLVNDLNAEYVNGIPASFVPLPLNLLALDANGDLPTDITGDAQTLGGLHANEIDAATVGGFAATEIGAPTYGRVMAVFDECVNALTHTEFYPFPLNAGTRADAAGTANHPGCYLLSGRSSAANTGYAMMTGLNAFLIAGGEEFEAIFKMTAAHAENAARFGFSNKNDSTAAPVGVYLRVNGTTIDGYCKDGAGATATGTAYTYSAGTWYRARPVVNAAANLVTFTLYDDAGNSLWTNTVNANIPDGAGEETGAGMVFYQSSTTLRTMTLDWMVARVNRTMTR